MENTDNKNMEQTVLPETVFSYDDIKDVKSENIKSEGIKYEDIENIESESDENAIDDIIRLLDDYNRMEGSRMTLKVTGQEGITREYHHGRCDVCSPWAKGTPFDVIDDEDCD